MDKLPRIFNRYKPYIEEQLKSSLKPRQLPFYDMLRYHMGWVDSEGREIEASGGKYLRATLCLLASESLSSDFKPALPLAEAIEYIHNFSLVHDDIQDNDLMRRHKPTVWSIWGKPQAINAGSAMRMVASLAVHKLNNYHISCQRQMKAASIMDRACLKMIEGQYLDISFEQKKTISLDDYLDMIEKKTAALIEASLMMGACLHTRGEKLEAFGMLGKNLGLAFQIKDDILGIWGNDKKTGKSSGSDILKKKKSMPVVYLMENAGPKISKSLTDIYNQDEISTKDKQIILSYLEQAGARQYCQEQADYYYLKSQQALEEIPLAGDTKKDYLEISEFLVKREF
ncbi:MAG: polyprenyl synthetase family protein [Actinomycetia bacterium]|nr:polyprenyl synthetase family protein [Actinomycetes bacterium]